MVLVDRAVSVGATRVRQVSADAAFEEAFATLASELSVVFTARFVTANNAFCARESAVEYEVA